jgi:uncharacterized protein (DUF58 family)
MSYKDDALTFAQASAIRAVKTFAQTAVSLVGTNTMGITQIDWVGVLSGAALAAVLSVLTSIATGLPEVPVQKAPAADSEKPGAEEADA